MPCPQAAGRLPVLLVPARDSDLQLSCLVRASASAQLVGARGDCGSLYAVAVQLDTGRSRSAGTGHFEGRPPGLQEPAKAGRAEWGRHVQARL